MTSAHAFDSTLNDALGYDLSHLDLSGRRILVVEDDLVVAQVIMSVLRELRCEVAGPLVDASAVWDSISDFPPDLVLMDIGIEGQQDGIDTAAMIREQFGVPVIFLSGATEPEVVERARRVRPLGYLVKPIKPVMLRNAVEMAFWREAAEQRLRERERWMSATLDAIDLGIVTADEFGAVTHLNAKAEQLLGRRFAAVEGSRLIDLVQLRAPADNGAIDLLSQAGHACNAMLVPVDDRPAVAVNCTVTELVNTIPPLIETQAKTTLGYVVTLNLKTAVDRLEAQLTI